MRDDAVAEVVGVILILAITVAVATILAAYALGMGSSIKKPYEVYFTLNKAAPNDDIIITNAGGPDLALLQKIEISYTDANDTQTSFAQPATIIASNSGHASGDLNNQSTSILKLDSTIVNSYSKCHVIIRGTFPDGTKQVLLQGYV